MDRSRQILWDFWGFEKFRPQQEDIVDDAINGHDVLALLPTGGGKSVCFQVPGIAREGLTIVISPLIALMQDQIQNLQRRGIQAKAITSGMSFREIDITLDNARFGGLKFLYISPERITTTVFHERLKAMEVGLVVVDEAHCISEWGHDFRPAFMNIRFIREIHPGTPIIALTATATDRVRKDIITQLAMKDPIIHEASFSRPNLSYEVYKSSNKTQSILSFLSENANDCGIVYCQTRKSVKEVAKLLFAHGISAGIYHGGMDNVSRSDMLNAWLAGKIKVMVATNAFGMGIDKPDVRNVLHYELPNSLEAYFQEAGRGGRDGNPSRAIVFWEDQDMIRLQEQFSIQFPPIETIKLTYRALCNHLRVAIGSGKNETYFFDIRKLCEHFKLELLATYNCLKFLELNGDLSFSEGVFHPTKVKFAVGNRELYNFQVKQEKYLNLSTLLSRSYPGIFEQYFEINEAEIHKRLKVTKDELNRQLQELEKFGILDISWSSDLPSVTFLHERLPDDYLVIAPEVYRFRLENAHTKLDAVTAYIMSDECRSLKLINYFGQESNSCGNCDICKRKNEHKNAKELIDSTLSLLEEKLSIQQLSSKIGIKENALKPILRQLLLDELIELENGLWSKK